ncbi:AglZ/HisF2 family acetamidino modification protein [Peristeroidobacter soli]|uniref:AglZ/HisF2 family acetamidino modification protein n=1 Tax=Peristeroidobacter soli TaxID=2497877 RepID=UPI00101CDB94|nr:AglZ/HisF2 family acetamidino modification protein [Peristeroidobacter soli]
MLRPRIIACLLVSNKGLVKTVGFGDPKYVGDPINAVKIFNEKEVDELVVLDIDATVQGNGPDYKMIQQLAVECRMPLCYGGGVKSAEHAKTIIGLGVEKVAVSAALVENPNLVVAMAEEIGSQSVVAVLDLKKKRLSSRYEVWTHNGTVNTGKTAPEFASELQRLGVGEIVINSIDNDGRMKGYDLTMVSQVREAVDVPLSVLGGAGSLEDIAQLIGKFGVIGAAAGSLFVFKGAYRAVLINYPSAAQRDQLIRNHLPGA